MLQLTLTLVWVAAGLMVFAPRKWQTTKLHPSLSFLIQSALPIAFIFVLNITYRSNLVLISSLVFCIGIFLIAWREYKTDQSLGGNSVSALPFNNEKLHLIKLFLVAFFISSIVIFSTSNWTLKRPWPDLVHHWYPYIWASCATMAGLRPNYDFPLQYGSGPLLLTLLTNSTLRGFHWLLIFANAAYAATLILSLRLVLRDRLVFILSSSAMILAVAYWIGSSPAGFTATYYPSVGGLRYLPLAITTVTLLYNSSLRWVAASCFLAGIWSFDALVLSCFLAVIGQLPSLQRAFFAGLAGVMGFFSSLLIVWVINGEMDILAVFEFILSPPQAEKTVSISVFVLFACLLLSYAVSGKSERSNRLAMNVGFVALLYPLHRMYPAVIVNVLPFILIAIAGVMQERTKLLSNRAFWSLFTIFLIAAPLQ